MIPTCLNLREDQIAKVKEWRNTLHKLEDYEDCSMASDMTFEIFATGLGDEIHVKCQGKTLLLTISDDGRLL